MIAAICAPAYGAGVLSDDLGCRGGIMPDDHQPSADNVVGRRNRHDVQDKWWKRPITWIIGLAGALILAMVTALGTGIGNGILSSAKGHSSPSGPPVAIEEVGQIQTWEDYSFVVPGKVVLTSAQLSAMNRGVASSPSAYASWFLSRGGVIANKGIIGITVRGNASGPVTITDMQVVKHCGRPLANGTLFYSPSEGAGPFNTDQIGFDLGQEVTIGQYIPAPGPHPLSPGGNFFAKKVITLKPGEPQTLSAYVTAENEYCSFTFQLHVATPTGHAVTETITDNGKPFQISTDGDEGIMESGGSVPFSSYRAVYAGGGADTQNQGAFVRVNPATYKGAGDPGSFPLISAPRLQSGPLLGQLDGAFVHGLGFGQVMPSEIFNGGDPTGLVAQISWKSWGGSEAVGIGKAEYVGPNQTVAAGTEEPATIVAFDLGNCDGKLMYRAVEWYFPQHGQTFRPGQYENVCSGTFVAKP